MSFADYSYPWACAVFHMPIGTAQKSRWQNVARDRVGRHTSSMLMEPSLFVSINWNVSSNCVKFIDGWAMVAGKVDCVCLEVNISRRVSIVAFSFIFSRICTAHDDDDGGGSLLEPTPAATRAVFTKRERRHGRGVRLILFLFPLSLLSWLNYASTSATTSRSVLCAVRLAEKRTKEICCRARCATGAEHQANNEVHVPPRHGERFVCLLTITSALLEREKKSDFEKTLLDSLRMRTESPVSPAVWQIRRETGASLP